VDEVPGSRWIFPPPPRPIKLSNGSFETNLTGWTADSLLDTFTATAPATLVSTEPANPTPSGTEQLTDGGLENWTNATTPTNWTPTLSGSSTVNQETNLSNVHGGSYAARLDVDASNSYVMVNQTPSTTLGTWYKFSAWSKVNTGTAIINMNSQRNGNWTYTINTNYTQYASTFRESSSSPDQFYLGRNTATSKSIYYDDASISALTLSSLFSTVNTATANPVISTGVTLTPGTQAGIVMNLDSAATPNNFVIAYHDGTKVHLDKAVGERLTNNGFETAGGGGADIWEAGQKTQVMAPLVMKHQLFIPELTLQK